MAGQRRAKPSRQQGALRIEVYRHACANRPNNPLAAITAESRTPPAPRTSYADPPRLDPALRVAPSGRADAWPRLMKEATREKLTPEETVLLAKTHVVLSCMARVMQTIIPERVIGGRDVGA